MSTQYYTYQIGTIRGITNFLIENARIEQVVDIRVSQPVHAENRQSDCSHEQYMADIRKYDKNYQAQVEQQDKKQRIKTKEQLLTAKLKAAQEEIKALKALTKPIKRKAKRL